MLDQAERISSLHHLLALLMLPRGAAGRLLGELGVDYEEVVRRIEEEGPRRVRGMFGRHPDDPEWSLVRIHPGASGLDPREVLDRLLTRADMTPARGGAKLPARRRRAVAARPASSRPEEP